MPASHERRIAVGRYAAALRYTPDDAETLERLRAEVRACGLADKVAEAVASAPPIPLERAMEIADLLIRGAAAAERRAS